MSLQTLIASDVSDVFLNTEDFAENVLLMQGGSSLPDIPAIVSPVQHEVIGDDGYPVKVKGFDFLFDAADLTFTLTGAARVRRSDGTTYDAMAFGKMPPVEELDPYRDTVILHTKQVS